MTFNPVSHHQDGALYIDPKLLANALPHLSILMALYILMVSTLTHSKKSMARLCMHIHSVHF